VLPDRLPPAPAVAVASVVPAATRRSGLLAHRDFSWAWLSRVLFVTGSVFFQAYQPFLLIDALGFAPSEVPRLIFRSTLVQAAMMVVWSLIAGRLSDHTGRRKPIAMAGSVLQGLGLCLIAVAHSYTAFLVGVALTGMGHGIYEGVDLALVTEVLPAQHHERVAPGRRAARGTRDPGFQQRRLHAAISGGGGGPPAGGRPAVTAEERSLS
jgi:MFS family permease